MWSTFLDTAQRDLVETQASSVKTPSFVRPCSGRDEPMGKKDRECNIACCKPCFVGTAHLCLADTVVRFGTTSKKLQYSHIYHGCN